MNAPALSRRAFLSSTVGAVAGFELLTAPRHSIAQEGSGHLAIYDLKDLAELYRDWSRVRAHDQALPSYAVFEDAVVTCRDAVCAVYVFPQEGGIVSHCGFVVEIPEEHRSDSSRDRLFIVTCDHASRMRRGIGHEIVLANGRSIRPKQELSPPLDPQTKHPNNDLRILVCDREEFEGTRRFSLQRVDGVTGGAPAVTYEALPLRARISRVSNHSNIILSQNGAPGSVPERFINTEITEPDWRPSEEALATRYVELSGFNTAGHLDPGGSGSPVIIFSKTGFSVAGYQVSFGPRSRENPPKNKIDTGKRETRGHAAHINHAIELLRGAKYWRD